MPLSTEAERSLRAFRGWVTRRGKELDKIVSYVNVHSSPRGAEEIEEHLKQYNDSYNKYQTKLAELIENVTDDTDLATLEKDHTDVANEYFQGKTNALKVLQKAQTAPLQAVASASAPPPTNNSNQKPRICDVLKPFDLKADHNKTDLRNWVEKFKAYYSTSKMNAYEVTEQHAFFFACLSTGLCTKKHIDEKNKKWSHIPAEMKGRCWTCGKSHDRGE